MPKKNVMLEFSIGEISGVDSPAQKGARAVLMKRDASPAKGDMIRDVGEITALSDDHFLAQREGAEPVAGRLEDLEKSCSHDEWLLLEQRRARKKVITEPTEGHTHLVDLGMRAGETTFTRTEDGEDTHSHPYFVNPDGTVQLGLAAGHTHQVDASQVQVIANEQLDQLLEINKHTETEMTEDEIKDLQKRADRAEAINKLNTGERAHFDQLDADGADEFLAKSADERADLLAKQADEDPVVYKSDAGEEFRKSDGARLIEMAKREDKRERDLRKERAVNKQREFEKRAEDELKFFPGEVKVRAAILKSIDAIEDEELRSEALAALKAKSTELGKNFTTVGSSDAGSLEKAEGAQSRKAAEAEIEKMARDMISKSAEPLDFYDAYDRVMETNPQLAEQAVAG